MEVLGDGYITQHILNEIHRENEQRSFQIYVTDALYAIAKHGEMKKRYADIVKFDERKPVQPERTIDEMLAMLREVK